MREVIIELYIGLRMRHIALEMDARRLLHIICGGHFHGYECDEGGEPSILNPYNEGEGDDEELSRTELP